jgi:hypothetical protein
MTTNPREPNSERLRQAVLAAVEGWSPPKVVEWPAGLTAEEIDRLNARHEDLRRRWEQRQSRRAGPPPAEKVSWPRWTPWLVYPLVASLVFLIAASVREVSRLNTKLAALYAELAATKNALGDQAERVSSGLEDPLTNKDLPALERVLASLPLTSAENDNLAEVLGERLAASPAKHIRPARAAIAFRLALGQYLASRLRSIPVRRALESTWRAKTQFVLFSAGGNVISTGGDSLRRSAPPARWYATAGSDLREPEADEPGTAYRLSDITFSDDRPSLSAYVSALEALVSLHDASRAGVAAMPAIFEAVSRAESFTLADACLASSPRPASSAEQKPRKSRTGRTTSVALESLLRPSWRDDAPILIAAEHDAEQSVDSAADAGFDSDEFTLAHCWALSAFRSCKLSGFGVQAQNSEFQRRIEAVKRYFADRAEPYYCEGRFHLALGEERLSRAELETAMRSFGLAAELSRTAATLDDSCLKALNNQAWSLYRIAEIDATRGDLASARKQGAAASRIALDALIQVAKHPVPERMSTFPEYVDTFERAAIWRLHHDGQSRAEVRGEISAALGCLQPLFLNDPAARSKVVVAEGVPKLLRAVKSLEAILVAQM